MAITSTLKKTIQFSQQVKVDGKNAVIFSGTINSDDPANYTVNCSIMSQELYKANRDEIAIIRADFEDVVWAEQEEMSTGEEETVDEVAE